MSVAADKPPSDSPRRTPLYDLHRALGFAGYEMPVQYPMGVLKEHLHTRAAAGLFDVSHMGQIVLRAKRGDVDEAARALERLVPVDVLGLAVGRQRYAFFTNEAGGILDDLMIARFPDSLLLICNAARKAADEAHLRDALSDCCEIEALDSALIALQGPSAEAALAPLSPSVSSMRFMDARETSIMGAKCIATRSGYTGEDGFEISIPSSSAREIVETLLAQPNVAPIGLGARDSLRLEAGLCLYGADLDEATTPVEGGLSWAIQKIRRRDGSRAGGFPGAGVILDQLDAGAARRRIGLRPEGRASVRGGALLFAADDGGEPIGRVTLEVSAPLSTRLSRWAICPPLCRRLALASSPIYAESESPRRSSRFLSSNPATNTAEPSNSRRRVLLKFTEDHEWLKLDGDVATVGITEHAADALGDLVFVQLPEVGATLAKGDGAAVVESVKAASDVFAPLASEVVEVNEAIVNDPSLVNQDPLDAGWFFKLKLANVADFERLLDEHAYKALIS